MGGIAWLRNFDQVNDLAHRKGKPGLLPFQEIPGRSTCVKMGQNVLGNPLMAELITDKFAPLAIFNNHPGADADVIARINEPAWNNPAVHCIEPAGETFVPKFSDQHGAIALYDKISDVLTVWGDKTSGFTQMLVRDLQIAYAQADTAVYAPHVSRLVKQALLSIRP